MVKDGWHECHGFDLLVEDDIVIRAVKEDRNGNRVSASVYKWLKSYHCWVNVNGEKSYSAVREGLRTGRYQIS